MEKQGWTPEQIKLVLGDDKEAEKQFSERGGWKNTLIGTDQNFCKRLPYLAIAHQEMLHLLLAANVLVAVGGFLNLDFFDPRAGAVNFKIGGFPYMPFNKDIKLDVMFSLNPLNVETLYRFMKIEWPDYGPFDNNENLRIKWRTLNTISAFYARIRVCYS